MVRNEYFKIAKRMFKTNKDITGKDVVRKSDVLAFSDEDKKIVWKSHHEKHLSLCAWKRSGVFQADAFSTIPCLIDRSMV